MAPRLRVSRILAAVCVVFAISVIAGMITMVTFFEIQSSRLNATPFPTVESTTPAPAPETRLPRTLQPESYELFFQPLFYTELPKDQNGTRSQQNTLFSGNATVTLLCLETTASIFFHSRDLNLSGAAVEDVDAKRHIAAQLLPQESEAHIREVRLQGALQQGRTYRLSLDFQGEMSLSLEGLYLSQYQEGEGQERFLVTTFLEPTGARALFPCLDEPDMRAVFHVTIVHRERTTAVGNADVQDESNLDNGWKYTKFNPTPKISPYLVAFTVSNMAHVETTSPSGQKIRLHARPEAKSVGDLDYAAKVSGNISDYFQEKLGLDLHIKFLDQMALPDLKPAAMENWGLITYQESFLLYNSSVSSQQQKEEVAVTIAHELAHQWFGNLVSIKWWNELWLKEGFATYMSYLAVASVESFNMYDSFVMTDMMEAFKVDALASSRPLVVPEDAVETYESIWQMYDSISYSKGALVLRMLKDHIGETQFWNGIKNYLETFQLQSTTHQDLWESLQKEQTSGAMSISDFMAPWVNQSGYPVVTINTSNGRVAQNHFLYNHSVQSSLLWNIRINYMTSVDEQPKHFDLNVRGPVTKEFLQADRSQWILANAGCSGYFRVNYNRENWERLFRQLEAEPTRIPVINRGQIINDAFNLARAKLVNVTLALDSTRFLVNETHYLPWDAAMTNMQYLVEMFDRSEVFGPMQTYLQQHVAPLYQCFRNQTDNSTVPEDPAQQHSQRLAVVVACSYGHQDCVTMATAKFRDWMENKTSINSIHPNLRAAIYCQAVAAGGGAEWEFTWKMYLSCKEPSERERLLHALSCSRKVWLLNRLLEHTLDPEKIRLMDVSSTIQGVSMNAAGHALAWNFIRAHWSYVSLGDWTSVLQVVSRRFSTQFELEELQRFVGEQWWGQGGIGEQLMEQTRVNIQWVEENRVVVLHWFRQQQKNLAQGHRA
ncbi:unnamed protein product [Ophioblennius macclurei]